MLLAPADARHNPFLVIGKIAAVVGIEVLFVDQKIYERAIGGRKACVQDGGDFVRLMRVEDDVVLDEDDVLLGVNPKITRGCVLHLFL